MKKLSRFTLTALMAAGLETTSYSQETPANNASATAGAAKVYIDCSSCDFDFIKTQITFVNFVRDRTKADVHILITTQFTAAGGQEFTVEFIGQKAHSAMVDTLRYYSQTAESQDDIRKGLAKTLQLGLIRYVARTPLANDISVTYSKPALSTAGIDKWNYWVFSIDANTNFNGEKSRTYVYLYSKLNARRTTEKNRITFSIWGNDTTNVATYGRLYNWPAVVDNRNMAPAGWYVPTDEELKQLEMYLGMSQLDADAWEWRGTDEGGKLKESGTVHWNSPNYGATNESGFSALPGGYRLYDGYYYPMGYKHKLPCQVDNS